MKLVKCLISSGGVMWLLGGKSSAAPFLRCKPGAFEPNYKIHEQKMLFYSPSENYFKMFLYLFLCMLT